MSTPQEQRIAEENRLHRAVQRALAPAPRPELPSREVIGERLADHGKDSGREARKQWADDLDQLVSHVQALRRNPAMNAAQVELAVAGDVEARIARLLGDCDAQAALIASAERDVEKGIDDALGAKRPEWHALAAEYRAALLDMTGDERDAFIERVQGTRDADLLRFAIASVPPELSGVGFGIHARMFETALVIKDPSLLTRPADLKKRRAALAVAVDGIKRTAEELVNPEQVAALRALTGGKA